MNGFRLKKIHVDHYRCFEELKLRLEEDTTVLFAENGSGKTALLTALAMGVAAFQSGTPKTVTEPCSFRACSRSTPGHFSASIGR